MAGAKVCVTLAAMEKSPLVTVLWTMSLEFTMATNFRGNPICFTMKPAETQMEREETQLVFVSRTDKLRISPHA